LEVHALHPVHRYTHYLPAAHPDAALDITGFQKSGLSNALSSTPSWPSALSRWFSAKGCASFGSHAGTVLLDDPDHGVQGDRVLHRRYTVKR
jgi:hypothetical protein